MSRPARQNRILSVSFLIFLSANLIQLAFVGFDGTSVAASSRESPVVRAVRKVSPAVVNISSAHEVRRQINPFGGLGVDPFFEDFFRDFFDSRYEKRRQESSLGSGVIIDGKNGLILTNAHVVDRTGTITVMLQDERRFEATLVGADQTSDLAVLRIDTEEPLPAVAMGSSGDLMIGETVIAIGNPFGFSHTVTTGVISAVERSLRVKARTYHNFIQIDASINPGNSGGPLLNIDGELIGINTAIYSGAQGIGFAIPIDSAQKIVNDLIRYGEVKQAWIGIIVQNLNPKLSQYLNYAGKKGILIKAVESGSPAQSAGLRQGDILLSFAGKEVNTVVEYEALSKTLPAGGTVRLGYWRESSIRAASIRTGIFPLEKADELAMRLLGIKVVDLTDKTRHRYGIRSRDGAVISDVDKLSELGRIGARPGDVIRQLDDAGIGKKEDFDKALIKARNKNSVVLLIQRGGTGTYVTVSL